MNYSILTADRNTHFKVAALAIIAGIVVGVIGLNARDDGATSAATRTASSGPPLKATKVIQVTTSNNSEVR